MNSEISIQGPFGLNNCALLENIENAERYWSNIFYHQLVITMQFPLVLTLLKLSNTDESAAAPSGDM